MGLASKARAEARTEATIQTEPRVEIQTKTAPIASRENMSCLPVNNVEIVNNHDVFPPNTQTITIQTTTTPTAVQVNCAEEKRHNHSISFDSTQSENSKSINEAIRQRIINCWKANSLQQFYDMNALDKIIAKAQRISINLLGSITGIKNQENIIDLYALSLYDIGILADNSGSMAFSEGGERIEDLKYILGVLSKVITLFDEDGITVRFLNGDTNLDGLTSSEEVNDSIKNISFSGGTPLGPALLNKMLNPFVLQPIKSLLYGLKKPVLIYVLTDGAPDSKDSVFNTLRSLKQTLEKSKYGIGACRIEIAQLGSDIGAKNFLEELDNESYFGDIIDCTSGYEIEQEQCKSKGFDLSASLWLLKLLLGAIDSSYDSMD